jgi:uncharacterized protein (TIGR00369 family)
MRKIDRESEMTEMSESEIVEAYRAEGWSFFTDQGFIGLAGPFFYKSMAEGPTFRFPTLHKHHNRNGVLQGGALMTFIDRSLGATAREVSNTAFTATVQLNTHFVDSVRIGETVAATPTVVRITKQLVFMNATFEVESRTVAIAAGVWKRLAPRA